MLAALAGEADVPLLTWHLLQLPLGLLGDLWIQLAHLGMPVKEQNSPLSARGQELAQLKSSFQLKLACYPSKSLATCR